MAGYRQSSTEWSLGNDILVERDGHDFIGNTIRLIAVEGPGEEVRAVPFLSGQIVDLTTGDASGFIVQLEDIDEKFLTSKGFDKSAISEEALENILSGVDPSKLIVMPEDFTVKAGQINDPVFRLFEKMNQTGMSADDMSTVFSVVTQGHTGRITPEMRQQMDASAEAIRSGIVSTLNKPVIERTIRGDRTGQRGAPQFAALSIKDTLREMLAEERINMPNVTPRGTVFEWLQELSVKNPGKIDGNLGMVKRALNAIPDYRPKGLGGVAVGAATALGLAATGASASEVAAAVSPAPEATLNLLEKGDASVDNASLAATEITENAILSGVGMAAGGVVAGLTVAATAPAWVTGAVVFGVGTAVGIAGGYALDNLPELYEIAAEQPVFINYFDVLDDELLGENPPSHMLRLAELKEEIQTTEAELLAEQRQIPPDMLKIQVLEAKLEGTPEEPGLQGQYEEIFFALSEEQMVEDIARLQAGALAQLEEFGIDGTVLAPETPNAEETPAIDLIAQNPNALESIKRTAQEGGDTELAQAVELAQNTQSLEQEWDKLQGLITEQSPEAQQGYDIAAAAEQSSNQQLPANTL